MNVATESAAGAALEVGQLDRPMRERLIAAAARALTRAPAPAHMRVSMGYEPRPEQQRVLADASEFLLEAGLRAPAEAAPAGRVVLPPRTGKTVIAGHLVARSCLTTAFVVPTRTLVEQTVRELRTMLPDVPVGAWYGELRAPIAHGVNVTTYAMLQRAADVGDVPDPVARSGLVILDEAHHVLGPDRGRALRSTFDRAAPRIALTATPDYDEERTLCRSFPDLIHEITVEEALSLELLAPVRFWVVEVDASASRVSLVHGDLDPEELGRVMSAAPFLRSALLFRYYQGRNVSKAAIVACCSRQQAHDVHRFFCDHGPRDAPAPGLVLGDTPGQERRRILEAYEAGEIDTLIQVGVLIEGWTSLRCKLMIDLAPSISRVRATQKYFRVMTRAAEAEASIYVLLPKDLSGVPVLPNDLFGQSYREYECGTLIARPGTGDATASPAVHPQCPIAGVRLRQRVLSSGRFAPPALRRNDADGMRDVLASCPAFDPCDPPSMYRFRTLELAHPLFRGRGDSLMRWLGIPPRREAYVRWMGWMFPETAATLLLGDGAGSADSEDALDHGEGPVRYDDALVDIDRARDLHGANRKSVV